ncbi:MAG: ABC transporter ATP-binding protein [Reyranellaceae bacterium]
MNQALVLHGISHAYDAQPVVRELSLSAAPGELVCLVGPSGCGKTTTLRLVAGLERVQQGSIDIAGRRVADTHLHLPPEERSVGLMFQDFALFPHLSVLDNVAFGLRGQSAAKREGTARAMLQQVGMGDFAAAFPHMLSGGQQQRVALARALAPQPKIMLLDEPFSGLDTRLRQRVRDDALHVLKQSGTTTLLVTHDPEEAMFMADRIAMMDQGRIVQIGTPSEIYGEPKSRFVAEFFSDLNAIAGVVRNGRVATPFGPVPAGGLPENAPVEVLIRPEALRLELAGAADGKGVAARVVAARLLGRTSLVHLCLDLDPAHSHARPPAEDQHEHWHARVPGRFLPAEESVVRVELDTTQSFVFPLQGPK